MDRLLGNRDDDDDDDDDPTRTRKQAAAAAAEHQHHVDRHQHHPTTSSATTPTAAAQRNSENAADATRLRRNFARFSLLFAANHAAGLACLALAAADRGAAVGAAPLYLAYTVSALLVAVPATTRWGSRQAAVLGMALFALYAVSFAWGSAAATAAGTEAAAAWIPAVAGAAAGGAGAGVAWTAQGVYFAETVQRLRRLQQQQQEQQEQQQQQQMLLPERQDGAPNGGDDNNRRTLPDTAEEEEAAATILSSSIPAEDGSAATTAIMSRELAAAFAVSVLVTETVLDAAATALVEFAGAPWSAVFGGCAAVAVAVASTVALHGGAMDLSSYYSSDDDDENEEEEDGDDGNPDAADARSSSSSIVLDADVTAAEDEGTVDSSTLQQQQPPSSSLLVAWDQVTAALRLLISDSKMKYLFFFNAAFALAGAFLNSFVSGQVAEAAAGGDAGWVGLLVALHGVAAAAGAWGCGRAAAAPKEWILAAGALAFAAAALPFVARPAYRRWSWPWLVWVYAMEGLGRSTFEGTLKALFADYFGYAKEAAFANIILQYGLASAVAYFGSTRLHCTPTSSSSSWNDAYCVEYRDGSHHNVLAFALLVIGASVLAVAGIARASYLFHHPSDRDAFVDNKHAHHHHHHNHRPSLTPLRDRRASSNGLFAVRRKTYQAVELEMTEPDDNSKYSFVQRELPNVT